MFTKDDVEKIKLEHDIAIQSVFDQINKVEELVLIAKNTLDSGGKVLWCGSLFP